jgi:hypothetical protein
MNLDELLDKILLAPEPLDKKLTNITMLKLAIENVGVEAILKDINDKL